MSENLERDSRSLRICFGLALLLLGCGKGPSADVTADLAASFEGSAAQADALKAKAAFEEGRYKESLLLLHKVASRGALTAAQKKAMAGIVGRLLQVVENDPKLAGDTQLHRLMEMLVLKTMGEP